MGARSQWANVSDEAAWARKMGKACPCPYKTHIDGHSHGTAQMMQGLMHSCLAGLSHAPLSTPTTTEVSRASDRVVITYSLTEVYGDTTALDGLTLQVLEHSIFGFLGPSGTGETTAMKLLLGLSLLSLVAPSYVNLARR